MKLTLSFLMLMTSLAAHASAPMQKTQAPGYYHMMVGDYEVTTLFDGFFPMNAKELIKMPEKQREGYLTASHQHEVIPTSVNAFLINTGSRLILVDSGCGAMFGPSFGKVLDNFKASGYTPDQVDEIDITHMHTDHLGGIVRDGKAVFPNAVLRMDQKDADFWLNADNAKTVPAGMKDMFANAIAAVAPYKAANHFQPFQGKTEITTGVTASPSYGHTPGHTIYSIESHGQKLLLLGDTLHIEAIQFPDPSVNLIFDADPKAAMTARKKLLADAADQGYLIGASHLPFPGIGHVLKTKSGGAFRYLPLPYAPFEGPAPAAK